MTQRPFNRDEFYKLIGDYANQTIIAADATRLEQLLRDDENAQQSFCDYMSLHAELAWRESGTAQLSKAVELAATSPSIPHAPPAKLRSPILGFLGDIMGNGFPMPGPTSTFWLLFAFFPLLAALATVLVVVVFGIHVHVDGGAGDGRQVVAEAPAKPKPLIPIAASSPSARLARVADCIWADAANVPELDNEFRAGHLLSLQSGLAEIVFTNGAVMILQGPATLEVGTRTSAFLKQGKCAVTVESPLAKGFEIYTPGMKFTDLGTEFGVSIGRDGQQEMDVFRGKVAAELGGMSDHGDRRDWGSGLGADGSLTPSGTAPPNPQSLTSEAHPDSSPAPLIVTAGRAVAMAAPGKPIEQIAADEKQFVRQMPDRVRFPLFSTGVAVAIGEPDRHWDLVEINTDKNFKPQPVVVYEENSNFAHDKTDKAHWVSNSSPITDMPDGCLWTLRTHFDLTGFDPSTARIEGRMAVDNYMVEIHLNGKKLPIRAFSRKKSQATFWNSLKIDAGFTAGDNVLEIVIENAVKDKKSKSPNAMGLCVDWNGTARPASKAKAGD